MAPESGTTGSAAHLVTWLSRTVGMACLAALVPVVFIGRAQFPLLHPLWLAGVAGGLLALSVLIPTYAWRRGSIRIFLGLYAGLLAFGLFTWPLAWTSPEPPAEAPWLWICLSLGAVCAALVWGVRVGLGYTLVILLGFGAIRVTVAGGGIDPLLAAQEAVSSGIIPIGLLLTLNSFLEGVDELDESLAASQHAEKGMMLERTLVEHRRMLDGIIHDQVMTALVAAVHDDRPPAQVVSLAQQALTTLESAAAPPDDAQPVTADNLGRLLRDVVASVSEEAQVTVHTAPLAQWQIAAPVASLVSRAVREAVVNATKHAHASSIDVDVRPGAVGDLVILEVSVIDDGLGFDPGAVPEGRLGLKVSIAERMRLAGGATNVESVPGQGTTVTLSWRGSRPSVDETTDQTDRQLQALFSFVRVDAFVGVVWAIVVAQMILSWFALGPTAVIVPLLIAQLLGIVGTWLAVSSSPQERRLNILIAGATAVVAVTMAALVVSAPPEPDWVSQQRWLSVVVQVLLTVLLVRGRAVVAWAALAGYALVLSTWGLTWGIDPLLMARALAGPTLWLALGGFVLIGLNQIGSRILVARSASRDAAQALATGFSTLVLREVWIRELRDQVGPLLQRLADPDHEVTAAERQACRVAEARLRDGLRAGNLVSFGVSAAIEQARVRGVEVTLVDNRGSALPEPVRRATLRHLEEVLSGSASGRVVARTAPEGSEDAVTILSSAPGSGTTLATIDVHGGVKVKMP